MLELVLGIIGAAIVVALIVVLVIVRIRTRPRTLLGVAEPAAVPVAGAPKNRNRSVSDLDKVWKGQGLE